MITKMPPSKANGKKNTIAKTSPNNDLRQDE